MRKKLLLMAFALLGTVGAWATQVTYYVTRAGGAGTWFKADGSITDTNDWFAVSFASSDNVLTLTSSYKGINSNVETDKGFRINQGNSENIVSYILSVPSQGYTIVSYTFGAAPNGFNNNIMNISPNEDMSDAVSVRKTPVEGESQTSYTREEVNAQESKFYLQQQPGEAIDVTLTVVVKTTYDQLVKDYLTDDKIENVKHAGQYGYPKETTDSYEKIKSFVDKLTQENAEWTEEDYENVKSYYEAYIAETDKSYRKPVNFTVYMPLITGRNFCWHRKIRLLAEKLLKKRCPTKPHLFGIWTRTIN